MSVLVKLLECSHESCLCADASDVLEVIDHQLLINLSCVLFQDLVEFNIHLKIEIQLLTIKSHLRSASLPYS